MTEYEPPRPETVNETTGLTSTLQLHVSRVENIAKNFRDMISRLDLLGTDLRGSRPAAAPSAATDKCERPGVVGAISDSLDRLEIVACDMGEAMTWVEGA